VQTTSHVFKKRVKKLLIETNFSFAEIFLTLENVPKFSCLQRFRNYTGPQYKAPSIRCIFRPQSMSEMKQTRDVFTPRPDTQKRRKYSVVCIRHMRNNNILARNLHSYFKPNKVVRLYANFSP
jgi:hypothetical protein